MAGQCKFGPLPLYPTSCLYPPHKSPAHCQDVLQSYKTCSHQCEHPRPLGIISCKFFSRLYCVWLIRNTVVADFLMFLGPMGNFSSTSDRSTIIPSIGNIVWYVGNDSVQTCIVWLSLHGYVPDGMVSLDLPLFLLFLSIVTVDRISVLYGRSYW